jgi:uncharacterized protein YndB with AHSA1/START domain
VFTMTIVRHGLLACLCSLLAAAPAGAEVKNATADGFSVEHQAQVAASPQKVYAALGQIGQWWNDEHTFSGKARNLSLQLQAGGCFCERWRDGSVEHGRVLYARNGQVLRLQSALGPLQDLAITGILAFTLEAKESGTAVLLSYRVHGPSGQQLDKLAPVVDGVLGDQFARLQKYLQAGKTK